MRFYFWRYLAVACHKLSHFNSRVFILDFTWNSCNLLEAKKFSRNPGQSKCAARETRYHVCIAALLIRNQSSQVAELVWRTMPKILYFSESHQVFQISSGRNPLYDRVENLFIYWSGRHNFGPGSQFQQIYRPGKPPRSIAPGYLDREYQSTYLRKFSVVKKW